MALDAAFRGESPAWAWRAGGGCDGAGRRWRWCGGASGFERPARFRSTRSAGFAGFVRRRNFSAAGMGCWSARQCPAAGTVARRHRGIRCVRRPVSRCPEWGSAQGMTLQTLPDASVSAWCARVHFGTGLQTAFPYARTRWHIAAGKVASHLFAGQSCPEAPPVAVGVAALFESFVRAASCPCIPVRARRRTRLIQFDAAGAPCAAARGFTP